MSINVLYISRNRQLRDRLIASFSEQNPPMLQVACLDQGQSLPALDGYDLIIIDTFAGKLDLDLIQRINLAKQRAVVCGIVDNIELQNSIQAVNSGVHNLFQFPNDIQKIQGFINTYEQQSQNIVIEDSTSKHAFDLAAQVSGTDASVLIQGPSGVGKEILSKYIHQHSPRHSKPFVAINCAAIPENMLEGILFGHEKGAFTGAINANTGKFEQANGGTLLLDEISEMPLMLQAKILRVLQEREVEKLGSKKAIPLDVRIIATSNQDLKHQVSIGKFREDLFFRLSVFPIYLSALKERKNDIVPLAQLFISKYKTNTQSGLSINAKNKLLAHDWPGNVRELNNVIQRACILSANDLIDEVHIQFDSVSSTSNPLSSSSLYDHLRVNESEIIIKALNSNNGNRKKTAEELGISPRTLRYKLSQLKQSGISIPARHS